MRDPQPNTSGNYISSVEWNICYATHISGKGEVGHFLLKLICFFHELEGTDVKDRICLAHRFDTSCCYEECFRLLRVPSLSSDSSHRGV